ncbi:hypothetical protein TWF191_003457 [Orbilia oligospora]|uniref:Uncharacterized protein n=1 Tax=Orbilia oligospora TaxID=2813651 RepID=A0A7C8UJN3_ORBOL|nr:hypothetical protein TWF191_003457 [Orbilia oligospora]
MPDKASGKILKSLLNAFFMMGGVLIATSNRLPETLVSAEWRKEEFGVFEEVLKRRCEIWDMKGGIDWRRRSGEGRIVQVPANTIGLEEGRVVEVPKFYFLKEGDMQEAWKEAVETAATGDEEVWTERSLVVYGREVLLKRARNGAAFFTFDELCVELLGPADYITIASNFSTIIIDQVPVLTSKSHRHEARRFITLLDAIYECRCKLLIRAEVPIENLFFPDAAEKNANSQEEDLIHLEAFAEAHQDLTVPFRPNISLYEQLPEDPNDPLTWKRKRYTVADQDSDFRGKVDFTSVKKYTGEDEKFSFKRAVSRVWEMKALPTILLGLHWLAVKANPVSHEARSVDLLTWLESSDWSNPAVEKGMHRDSTPDTKRKETDKKKETPEEKRKKEQNQKMGDAIDRVLKNNQPDLETKAKTQPQPQDQAATGQQEQAPKLKKRQFMDLLSWDNAKTAANWAWPQVEPFLQQFVNKLTQASNSALDNKNEIQSVVEASKFVIGNGNPVDQKKKKRDLSHLDELEVEEEEDEIVEEEEDVQAGKEGSGKERGNTGSEKLWKRDGGGSERLKKREDYNGFLAIVDQMGLDEITEQKLTILFQTQTIMSHVSEIVLASYFYAKYMAERVPDCAKTEFARWVNATAKNSSNAINVPSRNSAGQDTVVQVNLDQPAVLNPNQGAKKKRHTKRAAGTDPFGNAAPGNVLEATRQLFLDLEQLAVVVDEKVKLGNPNWPGMSADAQFVYESYLLNMVADRMRDTLERNMTDINKKVLAEEVKQVVGEISSLDLGAELINIAAADNSNNPYDLDPAQAGTYFHHHGYYNIYIHNFFCFNYNQHHFPNFDNDFDVHIHNYFHNFHYHIYNFHYLYDFYYFYNINKY